jgi:hypothetical protein
MMPSDCYLSAMNLVGKQEFFCTAPMIDQLLKFFVTFRRGRAHRRIPIFAAMTRRIRPSVVVGTRGVDRRHSIFCRSRVRAFAHVNISPPSDFGGPLFLIAGDGVCQAPGLTSIHEEQEGMQR